MVGAEVGDCDGFLWLVFVSFTVLFFLLNSDEEREKLVVTYASWNEDAINSRSNWWSYAVELHGDRWVYSECLLDASL